MVGGVKVGGLEEGGYSTLICLHLPVWCAAGSIQHLPQPQPQTLNGTSCLSPAPLHCFQAYVWYLADAGIFIVSLFFCFFVFFRFWRWEAKRTGLAMEEGWVEIKASALVHMFPQSWSDAMGWTWRFLPEAFWSVLNLLWWEISNVSRPDLPPCERNRSPVILPFIKNMFTMFLINCNL